MKASDFMIGDWVSSPILRSHGGGNYFHQLERIDLGCEYDPIPLTEEILKANKHKAVGISRFGFPNIVIDTHNSYVLKSFKYVHELQHALRLCGINDLADNFKVE